MIFFAKDMNEFFNNAIGVLSINMQAKAEKTAITLEEYVATLRESGVADSVIKQNLLEDLNSGGRIFGEFFNGIGLDVSGRLGELSRAASRFKMGVKKTDYMVWISVSIQGGDTKVCPDCEPRHGEVDTYENWVLRGLPKTGWSVCRTNCKCVIMKEEDVTGQESLKNPIKVLKGE